MNTVIFQIKGMHCQSCANTIQKLIEGHEGVSTAEASFSEKQVRILYDPDRITQEQLAQVIKEAGFSLV